MVNGIINLGIQWVIWYVIVVIFFSIIGCFWFGYIENKFVGVLKVFLGLSLVIIGVISIASFIFFLGGIVVNSLAILFHLSFLNGNIFASQFFKTYIALWIIDISSLIVFIISIKALFHLLMSKEEREKLKKDWIYNIKNQLGMDVEEEKEEREEAYNKLREKVVARMKTYNEEMEKKKQELEAKNVSRKQIRRILNDYSSKLDKKLK